MAYNKNALISTHTITQKVIDKIESMGPRGHEWLKLAARDMAGDPGYPSDGALVPISSGLAEELLARGPRAAHMAQVLIGAGGAGGSVPAPTPFSMTVTQPAGSANSPAMIAINGDQEPGNRPWTIEYDQDNSDPHTIAITSTPGLTRDEIGAALCAELVNEGVQCEYQNGVLYIQPNPPAQAVAITDVSP